MYEQGYMYGRAVKALGQNFLTDAGVARAEAAHSHGKNVLELGPGYGILTKELCKHAKRVVAVEKDYRLYTYLRSNVVSRKLKLVNKDFFKATDLELETGKADIMISNIPYALSSKTIEWLYSRNLQAVLCLQKEFVEHMLAREGSDSYSRLSVMCSLLFSVTRMMRVPRSAFSPAPKVDSVLVYLKPRANSVSDEEKRAINALMQHKKKTFRRAVLDSRAFFRVGKDRLAVIAGGMGCSETRLFKMGPEEILAACRELIYCLNE